MDRRPGMVLRMAWLFFYAKIQYGLKNLWMLLDLQVFGQKLFQQVYSEFLERNINQTLFLSQSL